MSHDELRQLREELNPLEDLDLINTFKTNFKQLINREKFDLFVTHKGKGTNFFNFLKNDLDIECKCDLFIQESDIKGKNIFLFDDAIRTGTTFNKIIKNILSKNPSKLTVACLLITNSSLEKINKSTNKKYDFRLLGMVIPDEYYELIYRRIFFPLIGKMVYYFEEYPEFVLDIKLNNGFDIKKIYNIIVSELTSKADDKFEVPFLTDHSGLIKLTVHFDIFPLKFDPTIKNEIILAKIRMWVYFNDTSKIKIYIKPIVHPHFKENLEKCSKSYEFCLKKTNIKIENICQTCITYVYCQKLGEFFYNLVGKELNNLNLKWEVEEKLPYEI